MQFDHPDDPRPIPPALAVERGQRRVNGPVRIILLGGIGVGALLTVWSVAAGAVVAALGFCGAWLWWSCHVPAWRDWAHARGADPDVLQSLAVQAGLTWPRGSFFERTEIRRRRRD